MVKLAIPSVLMFSEGWAAEAPLKAKPKTNTEQLPLFG